MVFHLYDNLDLIHYQFYNHFPFNQLCLQLLHDSTAIFNIVKSSFRFISISTFYSIAKHIWPIFIIFIQSPSKFWIVSVVFTVCNNCNYTVFIIYPFIIFDFWFIIVFAINSLFSRVKALIIRNLIKAIIPIQNLASNFSFIACACNILYSTIIYFL